MIKEIAQYIENEADGFAIGTNLFPGHIPISIDGDATVIIETPAGEINFYLPDYQGKVINVVNRARAYLEAKESADNIFNALHGSAGVSLPVVDAGPEYLADVIQALNPPGYIGQDERGFHEFSTNYMFRIQDLN